MLQHSCLKAEAQATKVLRSRIAGRLARGKGSIRRLAEARERFVILRLVLVEPIAHYRAGGCLASNKNRVAIAVSIVILVSPFLAHGRPPFHCFHVREEIQQTAS